MRLTNERIEISAPPGRDRLAALGARLRDRLGKHAYPLRFSIVDGAGSDLVIEATVVRFRPGEPFADAFDLLEIAEPRRRVPALDPFAVVQVVPTGIRCEVGGYAGDATPATNLLAAAADFVVTHPNAVNASDLNEMAANVLYVEGKTLDDFLLGHLALRPTIANRVGTFIDPTGSEQVDEIVHVLNAARSVAGIACTDAVMLAEAVGARIEWTAAGCASGTVAAPDVILDGVAALVGAGAQAVGGVSVIDGVTREMCERHVRGELPNPSGAVEAIITHLVSKVFRIPCAHAPLPYYAEVKDRSTDNPRASAEFISTPHYFSVLKGLGRAPQLEVLGIASDASASALTVGNVGAIVVPATALGGVPALAAEFHAIPLIAVP